MPDLYGLSESDKSWIQYLIEREVARLRNSSKWDELDPYYAQTPDVYLAQVPSGGIPARSGTTVGRAQCSIFKIVPADPLNFNTSTPTITAINNIDATPVKKYVCNLYPVKWYGAGSPYILITKDKFGFWMCEKPPYRHKAKPSANISPGSTPQNAKIWINGADSGDTISLYVNWMAGGVQVSSGKEVIAEYFEDEGKWVVVEAECE